MIYKLAAGRPRCIRPTQWRAVRTHQIIAITEGSGNWKRSCRDPSVMPGSRCWSARRLLFGSLTVGRSGRGAGYANARGIRLSPFGKSHPGGKPKPRRTGRPHRGAAVLVTTKFGIRPEARDGFDGYYGARCRLPRARRSRGADLPDAKSKRRFARSRDNRTCPKIDSPNCRRRPLERIRQAQSRALEVVAHEPGRKARSRRSVRLWQAAAGRACLVR